MIPLVVHRNPFLTWVLTSALLYSGLFWGWYSGLAAYVLSNDFTHIAALIIILMIFCNLSLGLMNFFLQKMVNTDWQNDVQSSYFFTQYDNLKLWMTVAPLLGLFGTVIGLSRLMHDAATVNIDTIVDLISNGTGAALFPTAAGILLTIVIKIQRHLSMHSFRVHGFARSL